VLLLVEFCSFFACAQETCMRYAQQQSDVLSYVCYVSPVVCTRRCSAGYGFIAASSAGVGLGAVVVAVRDEPLT
jgi:hypothetical protein